jgi:hypothetical protein
MDTDRQPIHNRCVQQWETTGKNQNNWDNNEYKMQRRDEINKHDGIFVWLWLGVVLP